MTEFSPSRYPYTYAADYLRQISTHGDLSRADASRIRKTIAAACGIDDATVASALADLYLEKWGIAKP